MIKQNPVRDENGVQYHPIKCWRPSFVAYMNNIFSSRYTGKCVEVGVAEGYNALSMLMHPEVQLVLVDNYCEFPEFEATMLDNMKSYNGRVQYYRMDSVEAAKKFADDTFDYVYLDGSHKHDQVLADMRAWYPKVREAGILAGHDGWIPEVAQAVTTFVGETNTVVFFINVKGNEQRFPSNVADVFDWWIYKLPQGFGIPNADSVTPSR